MEKAKKLLHFLDNNLELIFGSLFLALMVIFTFSNIAMRLILRSTLPWFQELTRYLFVWMVFIAASAAIKYKNHIRITFLQTVLKGKTKHIMEIIVYLCNGIFGSILAWHAFPMLKAFSDANMTASSMPWFKMSWLYAVMPLGMILFVLRNIQGIYEEIKLLKIHASDEEKEGGDN